MRLKLNLQGFRALRTSDTMDRLVLDAAERVARQAGDGFEAKLSPGRNRARAVVVPSTPEAAVEVARNPAGLVGAMEAARGV